MPPPESTFKFAFLWSALKAFLFRLEQCDHFPRNITRPFMHHDMNWHTKRNCNAMEAEKLCFLSKLFRVVIVAGSATHACGRKAIVVIFLQYKGCRRCDRGDHNLSDWRWKDEEHPVGAFRAWSLEMRAKRKWWGMVSWTPTLARSSAQPHANTTFSDQGGDEKSMQSSLRCCRWSTYN